VKTPTPTTLAVGDVERPTATALGSRSARFSQLRHSSSAQGRHGFVARARAVAGDPVIEALRSGGARGAQVGYVTFSTMCQTFANPSRQRWPGASSPPWFPRAPAEPVWPVVCVSSSRPSAACLPETGRNQATRVKRSGHSVNDYGHAHHRSSGVTPVMEPPPDMPISPPTKHPVGPGPRRHGCTKCRSNR